MGVYRTLGYLFLARLVLWTHFLEKINVYKHVDFWIAGTSQPHTVVHLYVSNIVHPLFKSWLKACFWLRLNKIWPACKPAEADGFPLYLYIMTILFTMKNTNVTVKLKLNLTWILNWSRMWLSSSFFWEITLPVTNNADIVDNYSTRDTVFFTLIYM